MNVTTHRAKTIFFLIALFGALTGCGPSAEDVAEELHQKEVRFEESREAFEIMGTKLADLSRKYGHPIENGHEAERLMEAYLQEYPDGYKSVGLRKELEKLGIRI